MRNGPYELVLAPADYPGMKYRGRYCYEHHLVWWRRTGETVTPGIVIHHKNEKKRDNRFDNLEKKTVADHTRHHVKPAKMKTFKCYICGTPVTRRLAFYVERVKRYGHSDFCCGHSCQMTKQWQDGVFDGK